MLKLSMSSDSPSTCRYFNGIDTLVRGDHRRYLLVRAAFYSLGWQEEERHVPVFTAWDWNNDIALLLQSFLFFLVSI